MNDPHGSSLVRREGPGVVSGASVVLTRGKRCYFFFRASFILSPGLNSEAPFDIPVVRESFILSPGENSDAPRDVGVVALFI
jgi:hypothetical protein